MWARKWPVCALALVLAVSAGCGGSKSASKRVEVITSPQAAASERPKPGTLVPFPPEPIDLESRWAWKDLWVGFKDLGKCKLSTFGLEANPDPQHAGEFTIQERDAHFVLAFDTTAIEAANCGSLQFQLTQAEHTAIWWARESDLGDKAYPFAGDRCAPCRMGESGVFTVDTADMENKANWNGKIRLIRIDPYGNPGAVITLKKVQAKLGKAAPFAEASEMEFALKPTSAARAAALTMRSKLTGAFPDLDAAAAQWYFDRGDSVDPGRADVVQRCKEEGIKRLAAGDAPGALQAFSAAARGSGRPVEVLYELRDGLDESQRAALWPKGPSLILDSFEYTRGEPFYPWSEKAGRTARTNEIVTDSAYEGKASVHLALSDPGKKEALSWYTVNVHAPVAPKPFSVRFRMRSLKPSSTKGLVLANLPAAKKYAYLSTSLEPVEDANGWQCIDLKLNVYDRLVTTEQSQGTDISNAVVDLVGLAVEGPANEFWLDGVEIYIPAGEPKPAPTS